MNSASIKARQKELEQRYNQLQAQNNDTVAEMRRLEGAHRELGELLKITELTEEMVPDDNHQPTKEEIRKSTKTV